MATKIPQSSYDSTQQTSCTREFDSRRSSNPNTNFQQEEYGTQGYGGTSRTESFHLREFGGEGFPNVPPNPLSEFLAQFLNAVVDLSIAVGKKLYTNSSVIVLAAGLAGGVHHFASPLSSLANAALDASFHGSVAVAKYVGLAFFIKTALTPIHEAFTRDERTHIGSSHSKREISYEVGKAKYNINSHVVSYLTPMALAWIVAYSREIPVKLAAATVYTMGTFGMMKLLGRGYDYALTKWGERQRTER